MQPQRIQRKRTKGWKMPENTVYVGRPGKWGNPCSLKDAYHLAANDLHGVDLPQTENKGAEYWVGLAEAIVIREYRTYLESNPELVAEAKRVLKGKNLACWCAPGKPCHADALLEIANQ